MFAQFSQKYSAAARNKCATAERDAVVGAAQCPLRTTVAGAMAQ